MRFWVAQAPKHRWWWLVLGVLVLSAVVATMVWRHLSQPVAATVLTSGVASASQPPTWVTLSGPHFSVEHLSDYTAKDSDLHTTDGNYFLVSTGLVTKHLAIAVATMNGHGLKEEPAYQMRSLAPETYQLQMRLIASQQVPVMMRLDNTEQVAFLVHGNQLGTLALTTSNSVHPPIDELNHMIASWRWK